MKNMEKTINKRIANTDIFILNYNPESGIYTYSKPFTQEEAQTLADETNKTIGSQYQGAKGLRQGLRVIGGELANMSTLKGIVANNILMQMSQGQRWLSTIAEGLALDEAGMLTPNVLIDFGTTLYDREAPDKDIAQAMMAVANERKYATPILASFTSLGLAQGGERYEVTPQLASAKGLIMGQDAVKALEKFAYKGNSGVRRLGRVGDGGWFAGWDDGLGDFFEYCRVGRYSAEGDEKKLREEALGAFNPIQQSLDSIVADSKAK